MTLKYCRVSRLHNNANHCCNMILSHYVNIYLGRNFTFQPMLINQNSKKKGTFLYYPNILKSCGLPSSFLFSLPLVIA